MGRGLYRVLTAASRPFVAGASWPTRRHRPARFGRRAATVSRLSMKPTFLIGLYRDAVYRYHTKGADAQLSQRWKGVDVPQISTDFSEFAKFFCSSTKKELKN
jgi:hypothetical protein